MRRVESFFIFHCCMAAQDYAPSNLATPDEVVRPDSKKKRARSITLRVILFLLTMILESHLEGSMRLIKRFEGASAMMYGIYSRYQLKSLRSKGNSVT